MKKILILFVMFCGLSFAQISLRTGMGINLTSSPSLKDYLNSIALPEDQLSTFNTSVTFSGEAGYMLAEDFEMGIEAAYNINSFTLPNLNGQYELSYNILMPSLTAYYVLKGQGYNFKFGGGAGPRFVTAEQILPFIRQAETFKSTGFGLLLRADGNTAIGTNLFANIGADIRYDINGEPKSSRNILYRNENVNFNSFSFGLRLGVSYIF